MHNMVHAVLKNDARQRVLVLHAVAGEYSMAMWQIEWWLRVCEKRCRGKGKKAQVFQHTCTSQYTKGPASKASRDILTSEAMTAPGCLHIRSHEKN